MIKLKFNLSYYFNYRSNIFVRALKKQNYLLLFLFYFYSIIYNNYKDKLCAQIYGTKEVVKNLEAEKNLVLNRKSRNKKLIDCERGGEGGRERETRNMKILDCCHYSWLNRRLQQHPIE